MMFTIEKASNCDFEHICSLDETVLGNPSRQDFLAETIGNSQCSVAREDGMVCGFIVMDRSFFGHSFIPLLIVHPEHRGRGVGTALMRAAESDCRSDKLFTSTNQSNLRMQRLCERIGFSKCGWVETLDEGDPEIIYMKRLAPGI